MNHRLPLWLGLGGVDRDDSPRAHVWQRRLHWLMFAVALLSGPAYLLDTARFHPALHATANALDAIIFGAFLGELAWMVHVSHFPGRYLIRNWLNLIILAAAFASLLGANTEWIAVVRTLRVALAALVTLRVLAEFRSLFKLHGAPLIVGVACIALAIAGALLYWVEPTVDSYWDGLWLAFVTGTTVGYGDLTPTTPAARIVAAFVVLAGVALIAIFTATIVAFFVGEDERHLRSDLHMDMKRLGHNLSLLIDDEELALRRDLQHEIRALQREIAALREALVAPGQRERSIATDRSVPSSKTQA